MSNIANIGTINNRVSTVSIGSTASSISMEKDVPRMANVSSGAQIATTSVGMLKNPLVSNSAGAVLSPLAATLTLGKILDDVNHGRDIASGDITTITGNVVGMIAAIGTLAGASSIAVPAVAISGVLVASGLILDGEVAKNIA